MGEVQLQFPDLDSTLAVSRVEVVSNVEVEAIKGALRWVFDELKKQQAASRLPDTAAMQQQIQDALAITSEQKAAIETLQNQQVCKPACMPFHCTLEAAPRLWSSYTASGSRAFGQLAYDAEKLLRVLSVSRSTLVVSTCRSNCCRRLTKPLSSCRHLNNHPQQLKGQDQDKKALQVAATNAKPRAVGTQSQCPSYRCWQDIQNSSCVLIRRIALQTLVCIPH